LPSPKTVLDSCEQSFDVSWEEQEADSLAKMCNVSTTLRTGEIKGPSASFFIMMRGKKKNRTGLIKVVVLLCCFAFVPHFFDQLEELKKIDRVTVWGKQ
jgi:hypothetical protein